MIVEDECIVAFDLTVALEGMGYTVVATAASCDEALCAARAQHPDLVLMDINIAGSSDGIVAGSMLRSKYNIPVVYLTANDGGEMLSRALATDPGGYLVKPYNERSLRTTIEVALRKHEADRGHEHERQQLVQSCKELASLARRFRREATRDPLTGLYNRRRLTHVIRREISFAQRDAHSVGFILLDLDRFKQLNDTYGHAAGDAVLRAVAEMIRSRIRLYDIACRYGGEEIVVVAPGANAAAAAVLAEHLRGGIEQLVVTVGRTQLPRITASFGVSSLADHGREIADVLNAADAALYQAKAQGRNRVVIATGRSGAGGAQREDSCHLTGESPHWAGVAADTAFGTELEPSDDSDF